MELDVVVHSCEIPLFTPLEMDRNGAEGDRCNFGAGRFQTMGKRGDIDCRNIFFCDQALLQERSNFMFADAWRKAPNTVRQGLLISGLCGRGHRILGGGVDLGCALGIGLAEYRHTLLGSKKFSGVARWVSDLRKSVRTLPEADRKADR